MSSARRQKKKKEQQASSAVWLTHHVVVAHTEKQHGRRLTHKTTTQLNYKTTAQSHRALTEYRSTPPMPPKPLQNCDPSWLRLVTNSSAQPNFL